MPLCHSHMTVEVFAVVFAQHTAQPWVVRAKGYRRLLWRKRAPLLIPVMLITGKWWSMVYNGLDINLLILCTCYLLVWVTSRSRWPAEHNASPVPHCVKQNDRLKKKIAAASGAVGISLDEGVHDDLKEIVTSKSTEFFEWLCMVELCTELFYAIILLCFLLICYPYILLYF